MATVCLTAGLALESSTPASLKAVNAHQSLFVQRIIISRRHTGEEPRSAITDRQSVLSEGLA
jgi:hypothetical protein